MRSTTRAFSPLAVSIAVALVPAGAFVFACAQDASDTNSPVPDSGPSTYDVVYYDTSVPPSPFDANLPPDDAEPPPPFDSGPPPPPVCAGTGTPCHTSTDDCPPPPNIFTPPFQCLAATAPTDAGALDAGDAGVPFDGVCVSGFDFIDCTGGKCGGSRCLLVANKCLAAGEVPCVCGDGGAGSPCGQ
jgi:hypothetical protein